MLNYLTNKIENNLLEVEDLIDLAINSKEEAVPILKDSINRYGWDDIESSEETKKVPLATWSLVIIAYLEGGYDGLKKYVISDGGEYINTARFVLAVLSEIRNKDTIKSIIRLFDSLIESPEINQVLAKKVISSINSLLSFPPFINIDNDDRELLRNFMHKYLVLYGTERDDKYTTFCALRGLEIWIPLS